MPRGKDSLKHQLRVAALTGLKDNHSIVSYRRACDAFCVWAKGQGIRDRREVTADVIQRYEEYLEGRPEQYTAATIHAKLAAPCKAAGISMNEIRKPKRTAGKIQRGRSETKTGRGERELADPRYSRLVELQKCVGVRRSELERLTGKDLIQDGHGRIYVHVERGKGGKSIDVFVLPEDRETVLRIFDGIGENERVFNAEEIPPHANLHKIRAEHAQKCYRYYADKLNTQERRERMRQTLLRRWEEGHRRLLASDPRKYEASKRKFVKDMDDRPVKLRGENKAKAEKLGLPTTYDRLALMTVSVMNLSHWRLDVSVTNYLTQ